MYRIIQYIQVEVNGLIQCKKRIILGILFDSITDTKRESTSFQIYLSISLRHVHVGLGREDHIASVLSEGVQESPKSAFVYEKSDLRKQKGIPLVFSTDHDVWLSIRYLSNPTETSPCLSPQGHFGGARKGKQGAPPR